jgi:Na+/H+ antiporter NhaD/arsenite permease-like protein
VNLEVFGLSRSSLFYCLLSILIFFLPAAVFASSSAGAPLDLSTSATGILGLTIFVVAYSFVPFESQIHLRKSKPVLLAAGLIWILVAIAYQSAGLPDAAGVALRHSIVEYAELFLFLLAAMTYINSMEERNVFEALRVSLVSRGYSFKQIFWLTGLLAFCISPIADNLTTALLMGAVVLAVGRGDKKFVSVGCVNVVVAANAGGAFSPFGDITTLMVWQAGKIEFFEFFAIFIPSAVNWLVPAVFFSMTIGDKKPEAQTELVELRYGAIPMVFLFLVTIATAVSFHNFLHLPPAAGMMLGLGFLGIFSYHVKRYEGRTGSFDAILGVMQDESRSPLKAFQGEEEVMQRVVQHLQFPAFAINTDHQVTCWNDELEALTGVQSDERVGTDKHWSPFYEAPRPALADLIVEKSSKDELDVYYPGRVRKVHDIDEGFRAVGYFPSLGEGGKWLAFTAAPLRDEEGKVVGAVEIVREVHDSEREQGHFDVMRRIAGAEWDTLLFFYGVILCVGGLGQFGYLTILSQLMYADLGATWANILVGILSALIDNIPVMFAVLAMDPVMPHSQWLLVTLTAGVGGSLLAIGSAAGVALLGTARGVYTFGSHLRWTPAIALGYAVSILCHLWLN